MSSFLDLQNGFYNGMSQGLGYPPGYPFQMVQPSAPLVSGANQDGNVWNYFNNIPPASLTQNYVLSPGAQFVNNYSGFLSALVGANNTFTQDVGQPCSDAWWKYVNTLPPTTTVSQYSTIFRNWAPRNGYMSVAGKGASDLAQYALDPILNAQGAMQLYTPAGSNSPTWDNGYNDLVAQLAKAPSRSFGVDSSSMNSSTTNTWAQQSTSGFFGLWGGSSSSSSQSSTFAASHVTVNASFGHVLPFLAVPVGWYSSSAMGLAFSHQTGSPWDPNNKTINWQNTFGANGNMQRFAGSLVVVSDMNVKVTSDAKFSTADQTAINNNSGAGMWPFYNSNSSSGGGTTASFDQNGHMTVQITSLPGVPVVIGIIVEPASQFVGNQVSFSVI